MRTLAYVLIAFVPSLQGFTPQPIWTEAEVVVLVDGQPIESAEVTLDGEYLGESKSLTGEGDYLTIQVNNYLDHNLSIFVDEVPHIRERSRDAHIVAGTRPSKIVINFTSR